MKNGIDFSIIVELKRIGIIYKITCPAGSSPFIKA